MRRSLIVTVFVLIIALAIAVWYRQANAQLVFASGEPARMYENAFLNVRFPHPQSWKVLEDHQNVQTITSLSDAPSVLASLQKSDASKLSLPLGSIAFTTLENLTIDVFDACSAKRLRDCPGLEHDIDALLTLTVFYEKFSGKPGQPANRNDPYEAMENRPCSVFRKAGFSRDGIDHVLTLCIDAKEGMEESARVKELEAMFEEVYRNLEYLSDRQI